MCNSPKWKLLEFSLKRWWLEMIVVVKKILYESVWKENDCCCIVLKKGLFLYYWKMLAMILKDNPHCCKNHHLKNECIVGPIDRE